jgi:peptidoglycan hydrolase-like protein with peptidoglycan-binding domain
VLAKIRERNVHIRSVQESASAAAIDSRDFDDDNAPGALRVLATAGAKRAAGVFMRHPADAVGVLLIGVASLVICVNALALQSGPHPAPMIRMESPVAVSLTSFTEKTGSVVGAPQPRVTHVSAPMAAPAPASVPAASTATDVARSRTQVVTDIQRELARKGFYEGNIDGLTGPKMDAAMRDFAQAARLKTAVEVGESFLQAVRDSSARAKPRALAAVAPAVPRPVTRPAATPAPSNSPRVLAVQRALSDFGYGPLKRSGHMDGETKTAIEKFERERHLPVTGQVSERMLRELAAVTGRPLEH